jgi:AcrR family transcriptional regulator
VSTAAGRRPGRPRSGEADQAIVRAALELLLEGGYRTLTMEAVRARSGVGKATLYRRFGSKEELVAHAVRHLHQDLGAPDTGSLRGDYEAISQAALATARTTNGAIFLPRLLAEAAGEPELHAIFYENLVRPRRAAMLEMLRRAVARGELRDDVDLELVVDLLTGPHIYRALISGGDIEQLFAPSELLEAVMRGLAR